MHILRILIIVGLGIPGFFLIRKINKIIDNVDKKINEINFINVNLLTDNANRMIQNTDLIVSQINIKEINNIIENIDINKINNIIYNIDSTIETIEFVPIKKDIKFLSNKVFEFIKDIVKFTLCIKKPNVIEESN